MNLKDVAIPILLALGVALQILAAVGLLAMRDTFDRLHYVGLSSFGLMPIAAAILIEESFSIIGDKAILVAVTSLATGPVLVHVIARTARIRRHGEWTIAEGERVERIGR
jgi:monovalent cation/proton antiporter MnhG/PhaG subunit